MDALLVITHDGAGNADELGPAVETLRAATDVALAETGDEESLERALDSAGERIVVVAGGDGSLHTVVAALHRRGELAGRTLGLLPLGTGNDFARTLGLPLEPVHAAEALLSGGRRRMDLVVDDRDRVVVNNVHVGTGAEAGRHGATWKERLSPFGLGLLGYPIGAARTALRPEVLRLRVEADGDVVVEPERPVLMVAVGNGASVGGGAEITPDADPADGRVDVMVSYATGPWARIGYAVDVLRARHPERDDVHTLRATAVTVSGEDFWVSADGELEGPVSHRSWRVLPTAYTLIVPA